MRTYQILSNLLSNAIKFTLKGSITVVVCIEESKRYSSSLSSSLVICLTFLNSDEDNIAEEVHSEAEDHNEVPHKEGIVGFGVLVFWFFGFLVFWFFGFLFLGFLVFWFFY